MAPAAASEAAGSSSPQARATASVRRGRIRAPPGNTAYRRALPRRGGQSVAVAPRTAASSPDSMREIRSIASLMSKLYDIDFCKLEWTYLPGSVNLRLVADEEKGEAEPRDHRRGRHGRP